MSKGVVIFMKVLGGAVALGTAITIPFVISDIIARSKGEGEESAKGVEENRVTVDCQVGSGENGSFFKESLEDYDEESIV